MKHWYKSCVSKTFLPGYQLLSFLRCLMMMSSVLYFVLLRACMMTAQESLSSSGTFFQEIKGDDEQNTDHDSPIIKQEFFSCGKSDSCPYLVREKETEKYKERSENDVIKAEDNFTAIWKKHNIIPGPFASCAEAYNKGFRKSMVYKIKLSNVSVILVRCDMTTEGGGWIVFQRRIDNTVDFFRNWADYEEGFGDLNGNFWLGLDKLHQFAGPGKKAILRVDLKHMDFNNLMFADYSTFQIADESDGYRLKVGGYAGNAGDSMDFQDGQKFSTKDQDNDSTFSNCAQAFLGGWWYNNCHFSNLNGIYPPDNDNQNATYMSWKSIMDKFGRITFSEMKLMNKG